MSRMTNILKTFLHVYIIKGHNENACRPTLCLPVDLSIKCNSLSLVKLFYLQFKCSRFH